MRGLDHDSINLLLFMAGVFVAMITGISVVQGVLTYILAISGWNVLAFIFEFKSIVIWFPG